jgi:putative transcriptional regulator
MKTKRNIDDELIEELEQVAAIEAGKPGGVTRVRRVPRTARESNVPEAPGYSHRRVSELRARMKLSQPLFAQALNVSPETVRAWEQGKRRPDGAALRLLQVTEQQPSLLLSMVREKGRSSYRAVRKGLGPSRLAQLTRDLQLTPEQRVLAAEETLRQAGVPRRPRRHHVLAFDRYEEFLDWKKSRGAPG